MRLGTAITQGEGRELVSLKTLELLLVFSLVFTLVKMKGPNKS